LFSLMICGRKAARGTGCLVRIVVLGSAAGGGFPQWNCCCPICREAWNGNPKAQFRTQSSVAVSAAVDSWLLLNASPDLRQQILATPALRPRGSARQSPISAVFLTNADVDHLSGLLCLRERQPFILYGTRATLAVIAANSLFAVLDGNLVERRCSELNIPLTTPAGLIVTPFAVPGKVPLYLETAAVTVGQENEDVVGLEISDGKSRLFYIPGCAAITDALVARVCRAPLLFFDGTTYADNEMIQLGLSQKTAKRMGHVAMTGADGAMTRLAGSDIGRKIFIHINNTNPVLIDGSAERRAVEAAGWEVAFDGMEIEL
jgi:pyrroloquinoline quinone biosynthesis protein B